MPPTYVRYHDAIETVPPGERETIEQILASMRRLSDRTQAQHAGHAIRVSHAKSFGLAVGELAVSDGLPEHLAQGLFARPARYDALVRLANVPGEIARDSVGSQRGMSLKVLGVEGEPGAQAHGRTQNFVLDTGSRFAAANAAEFLATHLQLEHMPQLPDALKAAASQAARTANAALEAVGGGSPKLDFFGSPRVHPLAEAYFTQAPIRYGDYVAKLAVVPAAPAQTALEGAPFDIRSDPDALRTATVAYLREHDADFDVRVQLCTSLETMPIEDATVEWPEDESPYVTVARLRLPRQDAYSDARRAYVDDALAFCVSDGLAAHRPLGGVMRARLAAYPAMSIHRRTANGDPLAEPESIAAVPA